MQRASKLAVEELKLEFDFSPWLAAGDTIASAAATVTSGTVVVDPARLTLTSPEVAFWLTGGRKGEVATVQILATTAGGEKLGELLVVPVTG